MSPGDSPHQMVANLLSERVPGTFCIVAHDKSKSQFEIYRYEAHDAFMNEARPEVYDSACAKTAWERTLKFLKTALT